MRKIWFANSLVTLVWIFVACGTDIPTNNSNENTNPQLVAIIAEPFTVMPGDTSVITIRVLNADINNLTISYEATAGTITGSGAQVTFIADSIEGVAWITVTVTDDQGNTLTGAATINIAATQPVMSIGAQVLEASGTANQCLVFSALPAETLFFLRVLIENPVGQTFEITGSVITPVPANQPFPLQFEGQCYSLLQGAYNFTFTLQRSAQSNSFAHKTTHVQP
ncbi:MAG: Ig-like domain-containing protein [bacterium]